jgi:hypothetical protein
VWQARRPSSRQPAQRSTRFIIEELPADTLAPLTRLSGRIRLRRRASEPKYWPMAVTLGSPAPPVVPRLKIEVSAGGASGAKPCHAASASLAWLHGKRTKNQEAPRARWAWRVSEVTMPKLPPPPPRQAQ